MTTTVLNKKTSEADSILIMFIVEHQNYISKLKPLYTAFLHSMKLSGYKMGIKFGKDPLALEQSNCASKILNDYNCKLPMIYILGQEIQLTTSNLGTVYLNN